MQISKLKKGGRWVGIPGTPAAAHRNIGPRELGEAGTLWALIGSAAHYPQNGANPETHIPGDAADANSARAAQEPPSPLRSSHGAQPQHEARGAGCGR